MNDENANDLRPRFWETVELGDMTRHEWESLCDGCGKCCLLKLEDEDTGDLRFTQVSCKLFDDKTCSCTNYALRQQIVPGCVILTPENIDRTDYFMPKTCAYRRLNQGQALMDWHPLITGDPNSPHSTGNSFQNRTISERDVKEEDLEDHLATEDI